MDPRIRLAIVAAVAAVAVAAVVLVSRSSKPTQSASPGPGSSFPGCQALPDPTATPKWYPKDLPMPAGSYVSEEIKSQKGLYRALFAVKGDLRAFVVHALNVWKAQGWNLGRGDAEPGEAEDNFNKPGNRYGAFRALSAFCDPKYTLVLIALNDPKVPTAPIPSYTPTQRGTVPSTPLK